MPRRSAEIKKGKPSPNSFFAPPWCSTYVRQLQRMCIHLYNKFSIIKDDCQGQKLSQNDFNFGYSVHFEALPQKQKKSCRICFILKGKAPFLRCFFVFYTLKRRSRYAGKGQYSSPTIISSSSATSRSL